jgi:hypothetical protein
MDHHLLNEVDVSSFKYFCKKNYLLSDEEKLNQLCGLFPGKTNNKVNYMHFLESCGLVDPGVAQQYVVKKDKTKEEQFAEDFASCVELYCRTKGLPVLQIFDVYDGGNKGFLTFSEFKGLAIDVNTEDSYGVIEIEKLFNYVDSNKSEKITKDEFFRIIMAKHYSEWLKVMYNAYNPHFDHMRIALRNRKCRNFTEFFETDKDIIGFETFNRKAPELEYDRRSESLFSLMKAFEDEEYSNHVNIAKVECRYEVTKTHRFD